MAQAVFKLTEHERDLLLKHYDFYHLLAVGARAPTTDAQRHFVAVCTGQAPPVTDHERAFVSLKKLSSLSRMTEKQIVQYGFLVEAPVGRETLEPEPSVPAPPTLSARTSDYGDIDEFGEGIPRPGWFSDEGWRKLRAGYRFDSRD